MYANRIFFPRRFTRDIKNFADRRLHISARFRIAVAAGLYSPVVVVVVLVAIRRWSEVGIYRHYGKAYARTFPRNASPFEISRGDPKQRTSVETLAFALACHRLCIQIKSAATAAAAAATTAAVK